MAEALGASRTPGLREVGFAARTRSPEDHFRQRGWPGAHLGCCVAAHDGGDRVAKGGSPSLVISPTGLFRRYGRFHAAGGMAHSQYARDGAPLDAFFTDFTSRLRGFFSDLMAGDQTAPLDFAAVLQVPGLRSMLTRSRSSKPRGRAVARVLRGAPRVAADVAVTGSAYCPG